MTHFIKKWSSEKFEAFADFLVEQYGIDKSNMLKRKMNELDTTDADFAYEEMICDACETMLLDSNVVEKLMRLKVTDLTLFEKIKAHIRGLLNKIRVEYKKLGLKPTSDEANALLKMEGVLEKVATMFEDAAVSAVENYQAVTSFESESVSVSEGIKKQAKASKKDPRYLDPRTVTEADVVELLNNVNSGAYYDNTYIPIRISTPPMLRYWAEQKRGDIIDDNPIVMSAGKAYQAMAQTRLGDDSRPHKLSVTDMISIIKSMNDPRYIVYQGENGRYVEVVNYNTEEGKRAFAVLEIGDYKDSPYMNGYEDGVFNILVTTFSPDSEKLQELLNNRKNEIVYDKQKDLPQGTSDSMVSSVLNDKPFCEDIIPQPKPIVKKQIKKTSDADYLDAVHRGDMETAQKMVDEAAKEHGYTNIFYHGAKKGGGFWEFDYNKAKKKGGLGFKALGQGNYFAANKLDGSELFGPRVIEAYLSIKEPLIVESGSG